MSAREQILRDIRAALRRRAPLPESVQRGLRRRLSEPVANLQPVLHGDPVEGFVSKVQSVKGTVARVAEIGEVSGAVVAHLETHGLPLELVVASEPPVEQVTWSNRLKIERRAANGQDRVSVTGAFAGVAETGTVVLLSSPESPTTLNFLPEDHIVVLRESSIVTHLEEVWSALRTAHAHLPRTVNLITGPSKTGDVEQTIQEGAHGPRRFHVILVGT